MHISFLLVYFKKTNCWSYRAVNTEPESEFSLLFSGTDMDILHQEGSSLSREVGKKIAVGISEWGQKRWLDTTVSLEGGFYIKTVWPIQLKMWNLDLWNHSIVQNIKILFKQSIKLDFWKIGLCIFKAIS